MVTAIPKKINKNEIGVVDILLPIDIEEQQQIGALFRSLDSLITLHQREETCAGKNNLLNLSKLRCRNRLIFFEILRKL